MNQNIHVWHLEITDGSLVPDRTADRPYRLECVPNPSPEFARFLYVTVGSSCSWYMRLPWTWGDWKARIDKPEVTFFVASLDGQPAGYFELERQGRDTVEICFFGLLPDFVGKGLGKMLLEDAIAEAWDYCGEPRSNGSKRVWLHTCTLDHSSALPNYQARGFRVFREEDVIENIPTLIEPWPGAAKPA